MGRQRGRHCRVPQLGESEELTDRNAQVADAHTPRSDACRGNARVEGDYAGSAKDYDAIETHILVMADALSAGIIKQFPQKFTGKKAH
jgi:hypothetical protein